MPATDRTGFTPWLRAGTGTRRRAALGFWAVTTHPAYDQLVGLPAYVEQPVPMPFEDINGHLNVRHYNGTGCST